MMLSICWVIPLFTCFNYIKSKSTKLNSSLNVCSQSEQAEIDAKCTPYVNNLMNLTNEYSNIQVTSEIAKDINTTCNKIPTCFGQFNCTEAQKNKETYERKCEKIEFTNYEMMDCVSKIYALYYRGNYFCGFGINFLTKDPKGRRQSYVDGEGCVKGIALRTKCDKKALEYLDSYYERFVQIMSTKRHGHKSDSLYHELVSKRCDPVKDKMNEEIIELKNEMKSSMELTSHEKTTQVWQTSDMRRWSKNTSVCDELKTCMESSYFSEDHTNETVELCNVMFEDVFNLCINEVKTREDAKTFPCFIDGEFRDPQNNTEFLKNKECIQYVMTGMCGYEILTNFDINWDNYQKNTNLTGGILI